MRRKMEVGVYLALGIVLGVGIASLSKLPAGPGGPGAGSEQGKAAGRHLLAAGNV